MNTLWVGLPQILNIFLLLFVIVSMFSIFAVQVFGTVKPGTRIQSIRTVDGADHNLVPRVSFGTYLQALKSLFQVLFGGDWNLIMFDAMVVEPLCTPTGSPALPDCGPGCVPSGDCGPGSITSALFWVIFVVVCEAVMLNLFVGMVLESFAKVAAQEASLVNKHVLEFIVDMWNKKGLANGSGMLPLGLVRSFLYRVPRPLGFLNEDGSCDINDLDRRALQLIVGELSSLVHKRKEIVMAFTESDSEISFLRVATEGNKMAIPNTSTLSLRNLLPKEEKERSFWGKLLDNMGHVTVEVCFPGWKRLCILSEYEAVTLEEVLMTTYYWHCPVMVCTQHKQARRKNAVQAFLHAEAGLLLRHFQRVRERKQKEKKANSGKGSGTNASKGGSAGSRGTKAVLGEGSAGSQTVNLETSSMVGTPGGHVSGPTPDEKGSRMGLISTTPKPSTLEERATSSPLPLGTERSNLMSLSSTQSLGPVPPTNSNEVESAPEHSNGIEGHEDPQEDDDTEETNVQSRRGA
eukprot:CAMPEP_0184323726 /NCGR_PEP_ID=MMETSP1049-20130417/131797_1 /TAXON_ID=77928 /ORGANISM="Proteomonas sulcata, Strain CCMP704" /LENGTH=518 /DNA_ID=CAMNT_0026645303 /DNA_START=57 /DNA_END=1613 /DNA_ORIENTATION=+